MLQTDVYTSHTFGYAMFRIPAIVVSAKGTVLAFAEGRRDGSGDSGQIDTVLRRSFDNGATWGPLQVVWSDGGNTCGNPAPVVDRRSGRIVLLGTWNRGEDKERQIRMGTARDTRRVYIGYSDDDGATWHGRRELTSSVKKVDWRWYATGPCHGIQLEDGTLVVSANHTTTETSAVHHSESHSHVILSRDGGTTWRPGGSAGGGTNESTVVELDDGSLLLNMRSGLGKNRRAVSRSRDRGRTWSPVESAPELIEPVCEGSLLKIPRPGGSVYLFSNPASRKRRKLTVRISHDQCRTWNRGLRLYSGQSAYSDLCLLPGGMVGCLYERDQAKPSRGRITFARFPVDIVENRSVSRRKKLPEREDTR